jgi:hypothetical protein
MTITCQYRYPKGLRKRLYGVNMSMPPPPYPRGWNPSRQWSRPISVNPVLAAAGACTSSRPSNAACRRARRPTLPRQPERRRDPARPDPISRRSHAAPASDPTCVRRTWQSNRRPNRLHAGHASTAIRPNIRPLRSCRTVSRRRQRRRHDWRNLQIPIGHRIRPADSFFGDFPTPAGVRNSSRQPPVCFRASDATMRTLTSGGRFGS